MSGIVIGTVRDANANLIATATVTIPGVPVRTTSGFFSGSYSSGGAYAVTAAAPGFVSATVTKPFLDGGTTTVLLTLQRS